MLGVNRNLILMLLIGIWPCLACIAAFNAAMDPFHLYHSDNLYVVDYAYVKLDDVGFIRTDHYYDAIMVNSSFMNNVDVGQADAIFKQRTLLLGIFGGGQQDILEITRYALSRNPGIRRAFVEFWQEPVCQNQRSSNGYLPADIMHGEPQAPVRYLLGKDMIWLSLQKLSILISGSVTAPFSSERSDVHNWFKLKRADFNNPERFRKLYYPGDIASTPQTSVQIEGQSKAWASCFDHYYGDLAREYPNVEFYLYATPLFQWRSWYLERSSWISVWQRGEDLAAATLPANAKLFDFNAAFDIADDCRRYMDIGHFDPRGNAEILGWMREGRYQKSPIASYPQSETVIRNAATKAACPPADGLEPLAHD